MVNDNEYHILIHQPKLGSFTHIRQGLATGDNKNYVRWWYEVEPSSIGFHCHSVESFLNSKKQYAPYNKGGDKTKWYATSKLVIQFDEKAYQALQKQGNHLPSKEYYFKRVLLGLYLGLIVLMLDTKKRDMFLMFRDHPFLLILL